ncbi:hypothetical protein ACHQM5_021265 [Ranunculus cassubicifolius]
MAEHVKQEWDSEQYQSDQQQFELPHQYQSESSAAALLPLFVPEQPKMSAFSADSTTTANRFAARVRGFFSQTQWHELELQALIFKYMLVRAPIPCQLIESIKRSLPGSDNNPAFYLNHSLPHYSHFQQGMLRSGYWGSAIDPEPGRCRRTDGKKWRCSKDVMLGQKYCERHMNRGRNRSRKPVEQPLSSSSTQPSTNNNGVLRTAIPISSSSRDIPFALSAPRYPGGIKQETGLLLNRAETGQTLLPFFNDMPCDQQQQHPNGFNVNLNQESSVSSTGLSICIPDDKQEPSDFSLKLATGNDNEQSTGERNRVNWMGGPLAEALRQSGSSSSPTSVLLGEERRAGSDLSGISN